MTAGGNGEIQTMTQCPQLIRHLHHTTIPFAVSLLRKIPHVQPRPGALAGMSAQSGPVRSLEMRLSQWGDASRLPVDTDGPLFSSSQSSTSGQINYQVICHYLLSKGLGRSGGGGGELVW